MINKTRLKELSKFLNLDLQTLKELDLCIQDTPGFAKWINIATADWEDSKINQNDRESVERWFKENDKYIFELSDVHSQPGKKKMIRQLLKLCKNYQISSYLDYGGGIGEEAIRVGKLGVKSSMADLPAITFDFAKWRADQHKVNVNFVSILSDQPISDSYDLISCFEVLQHLYKPETTVKHFVDHLNNPGYLVITTRFNNPTYPMALSTNYKYEEGMKGFIQDLGLSLHDQIYLYGPIERPKHIYVYKKGKKNNG